MGGGRRPSISRYLPDEEIRLVVVGGGIAQTSPPPVDSIMTNGAPRRALSPVIENHDGITVKHRCQNSTAGALSATAAEVAHSAEHLWQTPAHLRARRSRPSARNADADFCRLGLSR